MKLFAKYLPVLGDIKKGDKLIDPQWDSLGAVEALTDNEGEELMKKGATKVKLFICSRDTEGADKLTWIGSDNETIQTHLGSTIPNIKLSSGVPHPNWVKVIGEVSPEATWVKDGDRFKLEDLAILYDDGNYLCFRILPELKFTELITIAIKNPSCKHFH